MSKSLKIAEMFYTVQGEGSHVGQPAIFLRLAGCNLQCGAVGRDLDDVDPIEDEPTEDASWICDTIPEWKEPEFTYTSDELLSEFRERGWLEKLDQGAHLVLTGGEPTLPHHQSGFVDFMGKVEEEVSWPYVECETNGTLQPRKDFAHHIDQFNVSLKLSNSGHDEGRRLDTGTIRWHSRNFVETHTMKGVGSLFKFVVADENDVAEVEYLQKEYSIPEDAISVMPAGQTREQLRAVYPKVAELVKEKCWRFSPRLHVEIWNEQTGV